MDTKVRKGKEDFKCISENYSEHMYRNYDQLYRESDKKIEKIVQEFEDKEQAKRVAEQMREAKEGYYQRILWYKKKWDEDKEYGSIDRMIEEFK